jgi:predicted N-acetyltransferase YhbS
MDIQYRHGNKLNVEQVSALYRASTLSQRRPSDSLPTLSRMLEHANLVITAWDRDELVGIARSFSDFVYITYLADLAIHLDYQHKGIGKELIRRTQELGGSAHIILAAAPAAVDYYPKIGFTPHASAWWLNSGASLKV